MLLNLGTGLRPHRIGGAWLPTKLSGLIGWYDAGDPATITDTGGLIDGWADKSSTENDLVALTDNRPYTGTLTQNDLNMVDFTDATYAKYLSLTGATTGGPPTGLSSLASTVSFVFKQGAAASSGAPLAIKSATNSDAFVADLATQNRAYFPDDTGSGYMQFNPTIMPRGTAYLVTYVWSSAGIKCYVDGVEAGSDNAAGSNYINRFVLGYRPATSSAWKGGIGELCVMNRAITQGERAKLETYLMTKWGIV